MTDGIIKGTGNSRYLKTVSNAPTQYPTYEAFIQALAAGTLPIDLNGINSTGWTQTGTPLNKANLLTDATAALAGLPATATPNTMFAQLANLVKTNQDDLTDLDERKLQLITGSYTGNDTQNRHIDIGTPVSLIFIYRGAAWNNIHNHVDLSSTFAILPASGFTYYVSGPGELVKHTGSGFDIIGESYFNYNGYPYYYTAITTGD